MTKTKRPRVSMAMKSRPNQRGPRVESGALLFLGLCGAATACSLQNLDYLSYELVAADAGAKSCVALGGKSGLGGKNAIGGTHAAGKSAAAGQVGLAGHANASVGGQFSRSTGNGGQAANTPFGPYTFDDTAALAGWRTDSSAVVLNWVAEGEKDPLGSVQLTAPTTEHFVRDVPPTDVRGWTLVARLRSATPGASVKPYAMSSDWVWADGGIQALDTGWTLVSMDLEAPSYVSTGYDPTQVIAVGLQLSANATFTVDALWLE